MVRLAVIDLMNVVKSPTLLVKQRVKRLESVLLEDFGEVPLERPPIAMALCQLRFNSVPDLGARDTVEEIRDAFEGEYPDIEVREQQDLRLDLAPGIEIRQEAAPAHVLRSPHHPWWILIAPAVSTLVTNQYTSRSDFMARVGRLREVLADVGKVPAVQRIGVRYVNRVADGDFIADLPRYVDDHVVGGAQFLWSEAARLEQSLLDLVVHWDKSSARVRVGLVGAGVVPDPAVPPLDTPAWLLDVDTYEDTYTPMDESVDKVAVGLAENEYRIFRRIVTGEFLKRFGGLA